MSTERFWIYGGYFAAEVILLVCDSQFQASAIYLMKMRVKYHPVNLWDVWVAYVLIYW